MFTRLLQLRGIHVLATDLLDSRLKLAKQFGAKWAVKPDGVGRIRLVAPKRREDGRAARNSQHAIPNTQHVLDAAILAVPSDAALQQAFDLVRGAGQILLFAHTKRPNTRNPPALRDSASPHRGKPSAAGLGNPSALRTPHSALFPTDLSTICVDEKDLLGSYSADFTLQKEAARLVFARQLDVRNLITHRFLLEKTAEAVSLATHPTPDSLKVLVCANP
jgi:L-iditol 2-dehydrogenase